MFDRDGLVSWVSILEQQQEWRDRSSASIRDKLDRYLLNEDHPLGKSKAEWFKRALGFTRQNRSDLAQQIEFDESRAVETGQTQYGTKFNQLDSIRGVNGRTARVTTAWIKGDDGVPKLVTAIPEK